MTAAVFTEPWQATHTHTHEQPRNAKLSYESMTLTCFKYVQLTKVASAHTPLPIHLFMPVIENAAMWSSRKQDSLRLMKVSHDTLRYESTQWRKDTTPLRNLKHYFSGKLSRQKALVFKSDVVYNFVKQYAMSYIFTKEGGFRGMFHPDMCCMSWNQIWFTKSTVDLNFFCFIPGSCPFNTNFKLQCN